MLASYTKFNPQWKRIHIAHSVLRSTIAENAHRFSSTAGQGIWTDEVARERTLIENAFRSSRACLCLTRREPCEKICRGQTARRNARKARRAFGGAQAVRQRVTCAEPATRQA